MKHIIETENFFVCIEPEIFEADINLSTNTILKIDVKSNGFTASTTMDIDIKDLAKLGKDLCQILYLILDYSHNHYTFKHFGV